MPSTYLILCCPLFLLPSVFPSIRVFSNESALRMRWPKYWSFSFNINPSNEHPGLISFRMDWLDLLAVQGTLKSLLQHHSSKPSILWPRKIKSATVSTVSPSIWHEVIIKTKKKNYFSEYRNLSDLSVQKVFKTRLSRRGASRFKITKIAYTFGGLAPKIYLQWMPWRNQVIRDTALSEGQLLLQSRFSCVQLFVTPWTTAYQAPLPMGFSRQENWSGLPLPSPREGQRCRLKLWTLPPWFLELSTLLLKEEKKT